MHTVARRTSLPLLVALLGTLLVPLANPAPAHAQADFVVDDGGDATDTDAGDGECDAGDGVCTLRAAIQEANADPDETGGPYVIEIAVDTVTLDISGSGEGAAATGDLDVRIPVTIVGVGSGVTAQQGPATPPPVTITTAFDGEQDRVFHVLGTTATFEALRIEEGWAVGGDGGAILVHPLVESGGASPAQVVEGVGVTVSQSVLASNRADESGGAVAAFDATVSILDSAIVDNEAAFQGGGVLCDPCVLDVQRSIIESNDLEGGFNGITTQQIGQVGGGGLYVRAPAAAQTTVTDSRISDNFAPFEGFGGGILFIGQGADNGEGVGAQQVEGAATLVVTGTLIGGEAAGAPVPVAATPEAWAASREASSTAQAEPTQGPFGNSGARGGGIAVLSGNLSLDPTSTISGNLAFEGGGIALVPFEGQVAANDAGSTVTENSAFGNGGGYFVGFSFLLPFDSSAEPAQSDAPASLVVTGGTITDNTSGESEGPGSGGGGIASFGSEVVLQAGTVVSGNVTAGDGGGIYAGLSQSSTTIHDSIVEHNAAGAVRQSNGIEAQQDGPFGNVGGDGGGIYQSSGPLTIVDTAPLDNAPTRVADNLACDGESESCDAETVGASCCAEEGRGGGIYVGEIQQPTVITGATIAGNSGHEGGGLWMGEGDVVEIHDSTIADNRAFDGGGIYNETGDLTITGSLIGGPTAPIDEPQPVANVDLGNAATNNGGGIWAAFSATTELLDTRVVSNVSGFGAAQDTATAEPAVAAHFDSGGGIYNLDSMLTVADTDPDDGLPSEVSSNVARDAGCFVDGCAYGGGIYVGVDPSVVDISGTTFDRNIAHEGGALWVGSEDTVTVDASTFTDNWADFGGAVYQEGGSLTVTDSTFGGSGEGDGNGAGNEGGAIWASLLEVVENGAAEHVVRNELHVSGSDFIANTAETQGGAFWVNGNNNGPATDPLLTVTGGSVVGNESGLLFTGDATPETLAADGGGFWLGDVAARIDGTVIDANTAHSSSNGGGIYVGGTGALDLIDALVSDNAAGWGAGLWIGFNDIASVDGSTFTGNVAQFVGGGIYNGNGFLDVVNSTLTDNEALEGAALYSGGGGSSSLTNVTVHDNTATGDAEGDPAAVDEGESSVIVLTNTIVADNSPADCDGNIASGGHNIDTDGTCLPPAPAAVGDQPAVADAGLGDLGDYGGPTPTVPLLAGSPAIDAGNDDVCAEAAGGVDQRNVERPADGDGDGDAQCDIGAFERTDPVVSVTATDDGAEAGPDHGSFTLSLAQPAPEAVTVAFGIGGTATRGTDYTLHRGSAGGTAISGSSVTIAAEATSVVVAVKVIDDSAVEDDETVVLTLTDATPGSVGIPPAGTVTIVDNDRDEQEPGGEDRIETSIEVASLHFERGSAPIVIIARNDDYADALTGAPLARFLDGPILLTTKDVLDPRIATFIRDYLGSTEAYILGETAAISEQVEVQLQTEAGITTIHRIGGINRFETSGDIARFLQARLGAAAFAPTQFHAGETHVYVTEGIHPDPFRGWPDAVSVSGLAAEQLHPILLVRREEVPVETHQALDDIGADSATIIGGPVAVSGDVEFALELTGVDVDRVGGVDRYDTSRLVADLMKASGMSPKFTWLATGLNFPDALVAGPAVAIDDGILLLIHGLDLDASPASEEWLGANGPMIDFLRFLGGTEAITEAVRDEVRAAIG